jgi:hypothetical protein
MSEEQEKIKYLSPEEVMKYINRVIFEALLTQSEDELLNRLECRFEYFKSEIFKDELKEYRNLIDKRRADRSK